MALPYSRTTGMELYFS